MNDRMCKIHGYRTSKMYRINIICRLFLLFSLLTGCSSGVKEVIEDSYISKQVIVLFSPGGIGDMGYNDQILRGLQTIRQEKNFQLLFSAPSSLEEGEKIFSDWLNMDTGPVECLFILAGNEYEEMACRLLSAINSPNKQVLLFETAKSDIPAYTFRISMEGASYLAGAAAASLINGKAAVLCGSSNDATVNRAATGFTQGFIDHGGTGVDVFYLSDSWQGYAMSDSAYRKTAQLSQSYRFLFPVAGGSNLGVYRYAREFPEAIYTAGMDVDQSGYANQVTCSVVKRIDRLISYYINQWLEGKTMPQHAAYGLESGYIDLVLSPRYSENLLPIVSASREQAIAEESKIDSIYPSYSDKK